MYQTNKSFFKMKYLHIFLVGLMLLITFSCGGTNSQMQIHQQPEQKEMMIKVLDLNIDTSPDIWMQFFEEREASAFWKQLQLGGDKLEFDFENIPFTSIQINEQANQVVAGIIKYLLFYNNTIKSLSFSGNHILEELEVSATPPPLDSCLYRKRKLLNKNQHITYLPDEICQLTNLEFLEVRDHRLKQLPKKIGNLSNLQALILTDNKLENLPKSTGQLSNLIALSIMGNNFEHLPACITQFKDLQLREFFIDNKYLSLSEGVIRLTPELLKDYTYPSIPHSLTVLCAKSIKKYLEKHEGQEIFKEDILPIELQQAARCRLISQAKWPDRKMIIFKEIKVAEGDLFCEDEDEGEDYVETYHFPYYLPRHLCTPTNVEHILQSGSLIYLAPKRLEEDQVDIENKGLQGLEVAQPLYMGFTPEPQQELVEPSNWDYYTQ